MRSPYLYKGAYPVHRAPALYGVWGRVSVASLTLALCNARRPRLEPGTFRSQAVGLNRCTRPALLREPYLIRVRELLVGFETSEFYSCNV